MFKIDYKVLKGIFQQCKTEFGKEGSWCQNSMFNELGQYCSVGMIREYAQQGTYRFLRDIFKICNNIDLSIPDWNDTEGRTREEVVAAFNKCIKYCEERTNSEYQNCR